MSPLPALLLAALPSAAGEFDLPKGRFDVAVVSVEERGELVETTLSFPSAAKSPWPANDTVYAHLVTRKGLKGAPAVLVLPVMAAPNVWIESRFIERFARDGFAVLWLEMPTQFRRRPHPSQPSGQAFLGRTPCSLARNFRQSILDGRRALDVLGARPEADPERMAVFGISLGAIVGSTVYSLDPRLSFGFFLLGGADFPSLLLGSSMTRPFAEKLGVREADVRREWSAMDLGARREANRGKPALLVNARWDDVVPKPNALRLKEAFPDAEQVWVPGGHYSAIVHLLWLPRWASQRLEAAFKRGKNTIKTPKTP
jgi:dipeptidyl aminopeptidase/acylaminoacyl peptidase